MQITIKIILIFIYNLIFSYTLLAQGGWIQQTSNTILTLNDVFFLNDNTGFIGAEQGRILRTIDGGVTWEVQDMNIPDYFYSIHFPSNSIGYAVGGQTIISGVIYKTINGGVSWNPLQNIPTNSLMGTYFINDNTGFVISWPGPIYKTDNGGSSWSVSYNYNYLLSSIYFPSPNTGYACGAQGKVFKTVNQGASWTNISPVSITNQMIEEVHFINDNIGVLGCADGKIITTINGGTTWNLIYNMGSSTSIIGIHMKSQNEIYASGSFSNGTFSQAIILNTFDTGITWNQITFNHQYFANIHFPSNLVGYVVGREGSIYKLYNPVNIKFLSNLIPYKFSLSQNYPNPFNPSTKINFSLPKQSVVKLIIYDLLGREIHKLVNEELNAGTYSVEWNASGMPSGMYFYRIEIEEFSDIKKMILIK
jgi:photosystem II stability/assembly factor-like uncharacterized protein